MGIGNAYLRSLRPLLVYQGGYSFLSTPTRSGPYTASLAPWRTSSKDIIRENIPAMGMLSTYICVESFWKLSRSNRKASKPEKGTIPCCKSTTCRYKMDNFEDVFWVRKKRISKQRQIIKLWMSNTIFKKNKNSGSFWVIINPYSTKIMVVHNQSI